MLFDFEGSMSLDKYLKIKSNDPKLCTKIIFEWEALSFNYVKKSNQTLSTLSSIFKELFIKNNLGFKP